MAAIVFPLRSENTRRVLAIILAGTLAASWSSGRLLDPAATDKRHAQTQARELAALPGVPAAIPSPGPSLDPLSAIARNAAAPFAPAKPSPAPGFRFVGSAADRREATECLALTAMAEAGGSDAGQRAVIQVVLNRVRHPAFPRTICGVVFQGSDRQTGCQFTYTCDGSLSRRYPPSAWQAARRRAAEALNGYVFKPIGRATHYHTNWVYPYWSDSLDKLAQVDTHLFFLWRGFWGTAGAFNQAYRGAEPSLAMLLRQPADRPAGLNPAIAPTRDEAAEVTRVGLLAAGSTAGELIVSHPDGRSFMIGLKQGTAPASAIALARRLCGGNGYCQVLAWIGRASVPQAFPVPPPARARASLSYVLDDQNREAIAIDCSGAGANQMHACLPGTGTTMAENR